MAACSAVAMLHAAPVASEPLRGKDRRVCIDAYEQGQELQQAAKLVRARDAMAGCAKSKCGTFLYRECAARYNQLETEIPTVILVAKGDHGEALVDVEVTMDGALFSATLDGRALPVDPGLHQFSFKAKRGTTAEQRMIIVQGEQNRVIAASLGEKGAPKAPGSVPSRQIDEDVYSEPSGKPRWGVAPFVAAGVGLAGLGGYAIFTHWGRTDNAELAQCAPNCSEASVDHIRNLYVAADVSLGVGVVALGAAVWLLFSGDGAKEPPSAGKTTAFAFDVKPSPAGALATLSGAF